MTTLKTIGYIFVIAIALYVIYKRASWLYSFVKFKKDADSEENGNNT